MAAAEVPEVLPGNWPTNLHALVQPQPLVENLDVQVQARRLFAPPIFCSPAIGLVTTECVSGVVCFQTPTFQAARPQDPSHRAWSTSRNRNSCCLSCDPVAKPSHRARSTSSNRKSCCLSCDPMAAEPLCHQALSLKARGRALSTLEPNSTNKIGGWRGRPGLCRHAEAQRKKIKISCRHHHPSHLTPRELHDTVRPLSLMCM